MVRLCTVVNATKSPLRPLGNVGRSDEQHPVAPSEGLSPEDDLREPRRRRSIMGDLLPEHSGDIVLQEPQETKIPVQVPSVRGDIREAREGREAAGVRGGGAAVLGH
ncbi:hypothetical protein GQ457_10G007060 [Hibiscus cannabinus]